MARRVYLHVGVMKSATSYIQDLCDANRDRLLAQQLLWTRSGDNFLATDDLLGTQRSRPGLEGAWQRLAQQIEAHDGDALVSNELLAPVNERKRGRLVAALAPAEVSVIVTARDIARVIPSQWQTGARNRSTVGWRDYTASLVADDGNEVAAGFWRRQDLPAIVAHWAEQVTLDRLTVVTVPPSGVAPAVLGERFAAALGVSADGFEQPPASNPSVGLLSAELLRRVNERTADLEWLEYRWAFKHALARLVFAERASGEQTMTLDAGARAWARDRGARIAAELEASGVRVVGDLADLVPTVDPPVDEATGEAAADPSDAELLDTAVDGLVGLGAVLAEARIEHEALVRAVEASIQDKVTDADWEAFTAYEASLPEPPSERMVESRFVRWWLAR
ncbi:MAG TPA: hypothetical protein VLK34_03640 [Nocardioidaceae bacterium]|nr:hypothetical protein [Nocardioidaceae bacterium]